MHIDGLPFDRPGDKVGNNFNGEVPAGSNTVYRYFIPNDKALEGSHYISPGGVIGPPSITGCSVSCRSSLPNSVWLSAEGRGDADRVGLGSSHLARRRPVVP